MTNEQILELVKEHFVEDCDVLQYSANFDAFMKFALAIHEDGYNKGYEQCSFDMGDENV